MIAIKPPDKSSVLGFRYSSFKFQDTDTLTMPEGARAVSF